VLGTDGLATTTPAPVVFARAAHTRFAGRELLQLVYTIWFPERPPAWPGDILAGRLDGVMWRVTLADDGAPPRVRLDSSLRLLPPLRDYRARRRDAAAAHVRRAGARSRAALIPARGRGRPRAVQ